MIEKIKREGWHDYSLKENKDRFFFPQEYLTFEDFLSKKQKFSIRFLLNTGARINEARNVKVGDIDLANRRLVLRITKAKAKKGEVKGRGRPRVIPISTQFAKYLKAYILSKNLQPNDTLGLISTSGISQGMKLKARQSGIKDYSNFSAHSLRKTLEVWLMTLGVDSLPLTAHLGHDIATAAKYYVSPDIFSNQDRQIMRTIIGDLYLR